MQSQTVLQSFSTLLRCSGFDTSNDAIIHVGLGFQSTQLPAPQPRSPQEGNTLQIQLLALLRNYILFCLFLVSE